MNICVYPTNLRMLFMCVCVKCVYACIDRRGLGLPWCDRAGARRVWVTWANGFMVMAPVS